MSATQQAPPTTGSACWIEVPALDVQRAKAFYADVWGWTFTPDPSGTPRYAEDDMAMYTFPGSQLMGAIIKRDEASIQKRSKVGVVLYLYAASIDEQVEKVQKAGGKAVGERYPVFDMGAIQEFTDTEGNVGAMFTNAKCHGEGGPHKA